MQKRWLKDFELYINTTAASRGQELAQSGQVKNLREIEKHFWVAQVSDDKNVYETETIITPNKIKAFYCECFPTGRQLMCAHVAATLFKLRQYLEQIDNEKKAKSIQKAETSLGRMTVQKALEHASPEDLYSFVREYARSDRDFALALKTRFASQVTQAENPFVLILQSVAPNTNKLSSFKEADYRRLKKTLDGLESQAASSFQLRNFRHTWQITDAIFSTTTQLLTQKKLTRHDKYLEYAAWALKMAKRIFTTDAAPEIKQEIQQKILQAGLEKLIPLEIQRETIDFLTEIHPEAPFLAEIQTRYSEHPHPAPLFLLQLFISLMAQKNKPEAIQRVLVDYSEDATLLREIILLLYYQKHTAIVTYIAEFFLQKGVFKQGFRREIEDLIFTIARQENDQSRQNKHLRNRFLQSGHFEYFNQLKTNAGNDWPTELEILLQELHAKNDLKNIAAVLAAENKRDDLARFLENLDDFSTLQRYENVFLPENKNFVRDRYIHLLSEYLRDHFGRTASAFARERLQGLLNKGEAALVKEIIASLIEQVHDRPSLPEELSELYATINGQRRKLKLDF